MGCIDRCKGFGLKFPQVTKLNKGMIARRRPEEKKEAKLNLKKDQQAKIFLKVQLHYVTVIIIKKSYMLQSTGIEFPYCFFQIY